MCSMLRSMSARFCAPQTVVTRPTAMYGSMIAMAGEHRRARRGPSRGAAAQRRGRDPRLPADLGDAHRDLVDVAPRPVLARLERAEDRVPAALRVRGRMAVRRAGAAADVAALEADAQVDPLATAREAVLAAVDGVGQLEDLYVVEVAAGLGHRGLLYGWVNGRDTRNVVRPGSDSTVSDPPWPSATIRFAVASPRPVP